MSRFSIKNLEQLSGIKAHTIRIWEQRYGIIEPRRTKTNIRYYDNDALRRLLNVAFLNKHGIKISKISKLTDEEIAGAIDEITEDPTLYDDQIQALILSMMDMDEAHFEYIINQVTNKLGFENCMLNVLFPFLTRIGILWQTGSINPAQEHFISNLIRQKIIVAIDQIPVNKTDDGMKFLLFLPEGELHELSLLFSDLIIKKRNFKSVYLGQSLPLSDLGIVYRYHQPSHILTVITSNPGPSDVQKYLKQLSDIAPNAKIIVSGQRVVGQDLNLPQNTQIIVKPQDLIAILESDGKR
ncbi:MerR family transcriptional regulator [Marinoscillum sp. MHG1-6]|uniref:MerR family transcriptional regulator n=1 Tax=Marinoscillum sp. MHG1-6 TaxID=2959627 RepID=UPI0021585416|nr:MerR family transcriptional regulator [Marinoscillum sp. MHG1-6]